MMISDFHVILLDIIGVMFFIFCIADISRIFRRLLDEEKSQEQLTEEEIAYMRDLLDEVEED